MNKLDIKVEMTALDRKQRDFYNSLTAEEKKKFSAFSMLKCSSAVTNGGFDLEAYYLRATNDNVNTNFFELNRHTQLQWLLFTTVSPGLGTQRHYYPRSESKKKNTKHQILQGFYPMLKQDEIELLAELNDIRDIEDLARQNGWTDQELRVFKK
jgi:hypothetical protein